MENTAIMVVTGRIKNNSRKLDKEYWKWQRSGL